MVMGLPVSVTLRGERARSDRAEQVVQAVYADLRTVDRVFSTYRPASEISLLRAGALPYELASPQVREVLALCEHARTLTGGHFDADLPQPSGRRLLDPSGLVKGWAVERAARGLDGLDGLDWLVNAGGDVLGRASHGPAWQVAVEDPRDRARVLCVLPLQAGAVATSGAAARGRHILDPRTGGARPGPPAQRHRRRAVADLGGRARDRRVRRRPRGPVAHRWPERLPGAARAPGRPANRHAGPELPDPVGRDGQPPVGRASDLTWRGTMTGTTGHPYSAAVPTPRQRTKAVLGVLTTLLALWLGLTAPSVSPVAPPLPAVVQAAVLDRTAPAAGTADTADTGSVAPAAPPAAPAPAPATPGRGGRGGGGGGGRR